MKPFQEHFAENLSAFGWSVEPSEIADSELVDAQLRWVSDWWHGLDATAIVRTAGDASGGGKGGQ